MWTVLTKNWDHVGAMLAYLEIILRYVGHRGAILAIFCAGAQQRSSTAAHQHSSRAAEQHSSKAAEQHSSRAAQGGERPLACSKALAQLRQRNAMAERDSALLRREERSKNMCS
jgi:hypothetical protein